ncbi:Uu.00g017640.m01.CDS01 [Anthostomella pinea]|uniref:Uu.00g017640.m01.CDS01 n=1 Tax=Anthostomella pinea TaxID=933095 RepID=A0AAI8VZI3_9PEZI|nr:Uu.00g017640.m01.CDS01 [Anthostomella pinea]
MAPLIPSRHAARDVLSPLTPRSRQSTPGLKALTARILPRAATNVDTVPQGYGQTPFGPDAGTVVGIVLGSVAGFLFLLWLIYMVVNLGNGPSAVVETGSVRNGGGTSASVVSRHSKPRPHRHHSKRRSHHSSRSPAPGRRTTETVEIRRERMAAAPMLPRTPDRDQIVVEEHRSRSVSRPPPPMPPPAPRIVPDDDDDDEVVVIEEHTPPRRRDSRGHHRRRSSERRSGGGYRDVDPYRFAGGDGPVRDVSRRRSQSRR